MLRSRVAAASNNHGRALSSGLRINSNGWVFPLAPASKLLSSLPSSASSLSFSPIWSTSSIGHTGVGHVQPRRFLTSNDPFAALTKDHREVQALCDKILATESRKEQNELARELIKNMCVHCAIEEVHLYPLAHKYAPLKEGQRRDDSVPYRLEGEHRGLKTLLGDLEDTLDELKKMPEANWPPFPRNVLEDIRKYQMEHAQEEEGELFPLLKKNLDPVQQSSLMEKLENERSWAPLHPRPNIPESPPLKKVVSRAAGVMDRMNL